MVLGHTTSTGRPVTSIDEVLDGRLLHSVFQPLVDLETGRVTAYEALARGPVGSPYEAPVALFPAAANVDRLGELDRLCQLTAIETVLAGQWHRDLTLFVNIEPSTWSDESLRFISQARDQGLSVTVEITERDVAYDVSKLLRAVDGIRRVGGRIALDDVGANPASLALIPLIRPDVVKLDLTFVRTWSSGSVAETANAVRAYAEHTGAVIVAEGVESQADVDIARVLGATVAQGWHFGRPGELPATPGDVVTMPRPVSTVETKGAATPYDVVSAVRPTSVSTKRLLLPISVTLETCAFSLSVPPLLMATFQDNRHFTAGTAGRYTRLAERLPLTAAFGLGVPTAPAPRVRGAELDPDDPLCREWTVLVLGAHFAAALVARDLGDTGPDPDRRFRYAVTHDRDLVVEAARTLVDRMVSL
jgi:EAL domain-containing protein (putative c-di-GMP-specific phosphodiesterase class I)